MSNVVNLRPEEEPDPSLWATINGEKWYTYAAEYRFEDASWSFTVMARTFEEAEARIKAISGTGVIRGKLMSVV